MSEMQLQNPGDGKPPAQTPTGEIAPQPSPIQSETTTETTKESTPTTSPPTTPKDDKPPSLLNQKGPEGAPETYEAFKLPEGATLDEATTKEATGLFKGMNLSQAQAQSLVDFYVAKTQEAFQRPYKAFEDMRKGWVEEVKAHPEIRAAGIDQVRTTVARAINGLGDSALANDFRAAMDSTGAGDNPAFIRVFYKLAQMVTEGKPTAGGGPSAHGQRQPGTAPRDPAKAMYPNLP